MGFRPLFRYDEGNMLKSWVQLGARVAASGTGSLRHPYKLTYVVTKECHSRCVNCKIWQETPKNELTIEEVRLFAERNPHFSWIDFTGGEPTDRQDLPEIVEAFLRSNPGLLLVHFPTNGLEPDKIERAARAILKLKPPRLVISVSIDGPPAVNDALRGIKGDFDLAVETYRRLSALRGATVYAGMTLYPKNVGEVERTVEAIGGKVPGFTHRNLHLNFPHLSGHYYGNREASSANMIRERDLREKEFKTKVLQALASHAAVKGAPRSPFEWVEWLYQRKLTTYLDQDRSHEPTKTELRDENCN
jgi:MoaA/NifB/PqqE/SkfB family radical SAM enzyme